MFVSMQNSERIYEKQSVFEREAMPFMSALYNFALRMTSNSDDAHDLVQETYLKAFRFFDKFEKGTNCKAWLFRIMKNTYINDYRKESKEPEKVNFTDIQDYYSTLQGAESTTDDLQAQIFNNLLDDEITNALQKLPEDFRTVVILCDIENFTYEEIAEFIEAPIGTVRSRLHRGRKILQQKLYSYAREKGYLSSHGTPIPD